MDLFSRSLLIETEFFWYLWINALWNNGLMIVFYIILQDKIVILNSGIVKNVGGVGFLEQSIADVFFVSKNFVDGVCVPSFSSCSGENAVTF